MLPTLANKILSRSAAETRCEEWRKNGEQIVFTNGVFDLLHLGHVTYLAETAALGDRLILGLNDDASVRSLAKGEERPLNDEQSRAGVLAALASIDAVVIFSESTPLDLITTLSPDILVKGGDYDPESTDEASKKYIVGSKEVIASGGQVQVIDFVKGYSTTNVVNKIKGHGG